MKPIRKSVAAAAMASALVAGGAAGVALFGPSLAGAQTTPPTTATPGAGGRTHKSNEDATHEANETPEQEAAEDAGTFRGHGGHGSNEDAAHEANETPEREAAEDAARANGGAPGTPGTSGTHGSSTGGASRRIVRL